MPSSTVKGSAFERSDILPSESGGIGDRTVLVW